MKKLLICFCLMVTTLTACGTAFQSSVEEEILSQQVVIEPSDEIYEVLDVRETCYRQSDRADKIIIIVLENEEGNRAAFQYRSSIYEDNVIYSNLQILVPGDKVICVNENAFKIIKE